MKKTNWVQLPLDWLLLFGIVLAAVKCLQTAYELRVDAPLWLWALWLTGLFCVAFRLRRPWIPALAALLLTALVCWWLRHALRTNLSQLAHTVLNAVAGGYAWVDDVFSIRPPVGEIDFSPSFLLITAGMALACCASVVWLRSTLPCVLFCLVCVAPCFFLINTPPDVIWLVLLVAGLLVLSFSQGVRGRGSEESVQATLYALIPAALAVGLVLWLYPPADYEPPLDFEQLAERLVDAGEQISSNIDFSGGSADRVDLRSLGPKLQRTYTALTVTVDAPVDGTFYLRGRAYERFDGAGWEPGPHTESDSGLLGTDPGGAALTTVRVRTPRTYSELYAPYHMADPGLATVFDYYLPNDGRLRDYSFQMLQGMGKASLLSRQGSMIRQDAYENCLSLPDETRASLQRIAAANGIMTAASVEALADQIVSFVRQSAVYSLSPERPPSDEDFCTWFLTEAESGYCVHFASTATALLRAVGVPARYVEGYVTRIEPNTETVVQERQSHAWVEVYLDGQGWVRYDPTPPDGVADSASPQGAGAPTEQTEPDASAQTEPEATEPTEPAEPTEPGQDPDSTNGAEAPTEAEGEAAPGRRGGFPGWLWWPLGLAGLALALWSVRLLRSRSMRRRYALASGNEQAVLDWSRYERLCRALKTEPASTLEDLAKKAHFSQHELELPEREALAAAVRTQREALKTLPLPGRMWYSYWLI